MYFRILLLSVQFRNIADVSGSEISKACIVYYVLPSSFIQMIGHLILEDIVSELEANTYIASKTNLCRFLPSQR